MSFDHTTRQWAVRCTVIVGSRILYWNGMGWTDEEKCAALMTKVDANEAAIAIKALPPLQLSFCNDPQVVRLIEQ